MYTYVYVYLCVNNVLLQVASPEERTAGCQSNFYYNDLENLVRRKLLIPYNLAEKLVLFNRVFVSYQDRECVEDFFPYSQ